MNNMDRTRLIFIGIVGLAVVVICIIAGVVLINNRDQDATATPVAEVGG